MRDVCVQHDDTSRACSGHNPTSWQSLNLEARNVIRYQHANEAHLNEIANVQNFSGIALIQVVKVFRLG
jgi:hypothetical protein